MRDDVLGTVKYLITRSDLDGQRGRPIISADPLVSSAYVVAGARFELWKRPLTFEFLLTY